MITYHLKLNGQDPRVLLSDMEFVAGDVGAYRLVFSFFDQKAPLSLSGKTLSVKIKRADGVVLSDSGEMTDNTAVYIPKNDCFCVPGSVTFEIALMDSAKNYITTKIIHATVLEGVGEPSALAGDNSSVFVTLLAQTQAKLDAARELLNQTQSSLTEKADKATSLSGYGITDAYTKEEVKEFTSNTFANALKGYASGTALKMEDVSPLSHNMSVKLTSDSVTDFSSVTVKRYGKNLLNIHSVAGISNSSTHTIDGKKIKLMKQADGNSPSLAWSLGKYKDYVGKTVTISFILLEMGGALGSDTTIGYLYEGNVLTDPNAKAIVNTIAYKSKLNTKVYASVVVPETDRNTDLFVRLYMNKGNKEGDYCIVSDLQVEIGDTSSDYAEYVEPIEYVSNKEGEFTIPSINPCVTLIPLTNGVNIESEYNKDINKGFAELQNAIISLGGNV